MKVGIMKKLIALSPQSEISGRLVLAFTQNLHRDEIKPILRKYELEPTDADGWYPQQRLLDVFRDIEAGKTNVSQNLVAIGMKGAETAAYPPHIDSIKTAMLALPVIHELNHRNIPNVGREYEVEILGDTHIRVTNHSPYPNDTLYGFIWEIVKRFKTPEGRFTMRVVDRQAEDATFDIRWTE
jgi:hypothetical protein